MLPLLELGCPFSVLVSEVPFVQLSDPGTNVTDLLCLRSCDLGLGVMPWAPESQPFIFDLSQKVKKHSSSVFNLDSIIPAAFLMQMVDNVLLGHHK